MQWKSPSPIVLKTESCLSAEQLHEYSRHSTDSSARMQPASGNALSQHEGSEKYKGAQEYELYRDSSGNGIPTIILGAIIDDTRKEDSNCGELIEKTENILDDDAEAAICNKIISAHECSQSALRSIIRTCTCTPQSTVSLLALESRASAPASCVILRFRSFFTRTLLDFGLYEKMLKWKGLRRGETPWGA